MKISAYILSLVVLVLSICPCVDESIGTYAHNPQYTAENTQNAHPETSDSCSPFCTCQCCQTSTFPSTVNVVDIQMNTVYVIFSESPKLINTYYPDFYIPPKV